jgi:hypothetical protein
MSKRTVVVKPNLPQKEGIALIIKKAIRMYGGDYRGATYDPLTGKGSVS